MARILFKHQSEQLLGGTQIQRVVEIGATTTPSEIYFQFRMPAFGFNVAAAQIEADGFEGSIEATLQIPGVVDLAYFQDLSPSGQLLDHMMVFWESLDGADSGSFALPLSYVDPRGMAAYLEPAMTFQPIPKIPPGI